MSIEPIPFRWNGGIVSPETAREIERRYNAEPALKAEVERLRGACGTMIAEWTASRPIIRQSVGRASFEPVDEAVAGLRAALAPPDPQPAKEKE